MDTRLRPASTHPVPTTPPVVDPRDRAEEFVAWAAEVDDATWRSARIRVENLRFQRRRGAGRPA